jgi:chromosome segregation ATPase
VSVGELASYLIPALAVVATGLLTYRAGQRNTARQERADVVEGYDKLCEQYQKAIDLNNVEIGRLRGELKEIKTQFLQERDQWKQERLGLLARIRELERTNQRLEEQLDRLQDAQCKEVS